MDARIGVTAAVLAGIVSFLSPCVLPLIPGYVSFLTGMSLADVSSSERRRADVLVPASLFVVGFSAVFIALGASASLLGSFLVGYRDLLSRASGVVIFALGALMLGVVRPAWFFAEARFDMSRARSFGRWTALVAGMAFAFGWTPCVGPVLGSILMLAGRSGQVGQGVLLLAAYSLGLGIPFIAVALLLDRLGGALSWLKRHAEAIQRVSGVVLMVLGVAIATGVLGRAVLLLSRFLPTWATG